MDPRTTTTAVPVGPSDDLLVLSLSCPEAAGIVHAVSEVLYDNDCTIIELDQFDDQRTRRFFMRVRVAPTGEAPLDPAMLEQRLAPVAERFEMPWELVRHGAKRRVLIMVSKFGHCLNDLLYRERTGELPVEIVAVVSKRVRSSPSRSWQWITPSARRTWWPRDATPSARRSPMR